MKKVGKALLLVIGIVFICSCEKSVDYSGFEHYDLTEYEKIEYSYYDNYEKNNYAFAIIEHGEGDTVGLLYQVGENDYILLDTMMRHGTNLKVAYKFFGDKLYTVNLGPNSGVYVYTLNKSSLVKDEIEFDNLGLPFEIVKVDRDYIYYKSCYGDHGNLFGIFKCSFDDLTCIKEEDL